MPQNMLRHNRSSQDKAARPTGTGLYCVSFHGSLVCKTVVPLWVYYSFITVDYRPTMVLLLLMMPYYGRMTASASADISAGISADTSAYASAYAYLQI